MIALLTVLACTDTGADSGTTDSGPLPACEPPGPLDDTLRLHQLQALATHNSTHVEPDTVFDDSHRYTHATLATQLADLGVRGFELDLHLREGKGLQVFHLPVIDDETTCLQFSDCLAEAWAWSRDNPCHMPLVFWLEPKDDVDGLVADLLPLSGAWDLVDETIREGWPRERLLIPDDVRGDFDTLTDAIQAHGFPTLGELRGHAIFALLDSGDHRDEYLADRPTAEGRVIFPGADSAADPWAAMFKINDAAGSAATVAELAAQGFVITSNVDGATASDEDNAAKLAAAVAAGAHFLASDFPGPVDGRAYQAAIPGGEPAGCHPFTAPDDCTSAAIEDLDGGPNTATP